MNKKEETARLRTVCAERINQAIEERGITAKELSRRTGISEVDISSYRHGRYAPRQDRIYLLALALGVDPAWLWGFGEEQHPEDEIDMLINNLTDTELEQARDYMRFLILQRKNK